MDIFDKAWDRVEQADMCDRRGGAQWGRVKAEWRGQGEPRPVAPFIVRRANIGPAGEEPTDDQVKERLSRLAASSA